MKITILGAGSWGTAMGIHLARCGHTVTFQVREPELIPAMNEERENTLFLPGFPLDPAIHAVRDYGEALKEAEIILLAVPSQFVRGVLIEAATHIPTVPLVCLSKGIEVESLTRMSRVIHEVLGEDMPHAVLSGPTFAKEVAAGYPSAAVIASHDHDLACRIQEAFSSSRFRFYTSGDPVGVELSGALKNVIALAAGMAVGLDFGSNAVAALITRGLHEITRLGVALGGKRETFSGLAGMGDLILTCTGTLSRNRTVGERLGRGETLEEILASMTMVAEGVATTSSAHHLAEREEVEMPITEAVYAILYGGRTAKEMVAKLMTRALKEEDRL